jgi:uncharacterized alkaline shock family protein YloU
MAEETRSPGKTTIAPEVILNIARLTTLGVEGVSHMCGGTNVNDILHRGQRNDGARVQIEDGKVNLTLRVALNENVNLKRVGRSIQKEVARAITEMVGMEIGKIDIQIEDINYITEN